ncbi:MAG TPA: hypothetical protein ENN73_03935, partial [Firmicutes bacterium]|nr:hypothetical protein [Bacillota bacterium]
MFLISLLMIILVIALIALILYLSKDIKKVNDEDMAIRNIDYEVKYYLQDKTLLEKVIRYYIKNKSLPDNILKKDFEPAYCDYLIEKAKEALKNENFDLAEKYFDTFKDFSPGNPLNITKFIKLFLTARGLDEAYNLLKKILPIYGGNKEFYHSVQEIMQKKANAHLVKFEEEYPNPSPDELLKEYSQLIEIYPHRVYFIKLGDIYLQKEDRESAKDSFLRALDIPQKTDKLYKGTHHKLGMVLFELKQYKDSLYHLLEVLRIRPSHKSASSDLIFICQNLGIQTY